MSGRKRLRKGIHLEGGKSGLGSGCGGVKLQELTVVLKVMILDECIAE